MNYSVTPAALPAIDSVAKIETTSTGMTTEEADTIQADLSSIIRKAKPPKRNITRKQSTSLESLQQMKTSSSCLQTKEEPLLYLIKKATSKSAMNSSPVDHTGN